MMLTCLVWVLGVLCFDPVHIYTLSSPPCVDLDLGQRAAFGTGGFQAIQGDIAAKLGQRIWHGQWRPGMYMKPGLTSGTVNGAPAWICNVYMVVLLFVAAYKYIDITLVVCLSDVV